MSIFTIRKHRQPVPEPLARPRPTFTPRPPVATRPLEALAAPAHESMTDARRDRDLLVRVLDGLRALPGSRTSEFAADFRELRIFPRVAREVGWCGLHREQPAAGWPWYTVERWHRQAMAAIDRQFWEARSAADEQLGRAHAEIAMELDGYLRRPVIASGD